MVSSMVARSRLRFLFTPIALWLSGGFASVVLAQITPVWVAVEGQVTIECEDVNQVQDGTSWVIQDAGATAKAFGTGCLHWDRPGASVPPSLSYHVEIKEAGTYGFAIRAATAATSETPILRAKDERGRWLTLPGSSQGGWTVFQTASEEAWEFDPGIHKIELTATGASSLSLDRLFVYAISLGRPQEEAPPSPLLYPLEFDDTVAPSSPRNLRLKGHGTAHLHLEWDPSEDEESHVLAYDIYWRRRWVGRSFRPEYVMGHLTPYALYHVNVSAIDLGGNASRPTRIIAETNPFDAASGAEAQWVASPFAVDGAIDPEWQALRTYPLTHPEQAPVAAFRLAWDAQQLYLLVTGPSPDLRLTLDPGLTQVEWRDPRHPQFRFPGETKGARHALRQDEATSEYTHEIALPWTILQRDPPQTEDALLGLNVSLWHRDDTPQAAWHWQADPARPAQRPFQLGNVRLCRSIVSGKPDAWLPPNIWRVRDDHVVVEAEAIAHDTAWRVSTPSTAAGGEGVLTWQRPSHYPVPEIQDTFTDASTEYQGPQDKWLIVRVYTEKPGPYLCTVRFQQGSLPQRAWLSRVGHAASPQTPIHAIGIDGIPGASEGRSAAAFTWSSGEEHRFFLKKGINNLYLSPISETCAIDRIVLYREGSVVAREKALDPTTHPSQAFR